MKDYKNAPRLRWVTDKGDLWLLPISLLKDLTGLTRQGVDHHINLNAGLKIIEAYGRRWLEVSDFEEVLGKIMKK